MSVSRLLAATVTLGSLVVFSGCARAKVTTEIKPDGSWVRTVALTGQEKKEGMQMTPSLDEIFKFPTGAEWKSKQSKKAEDLTNTLERTMAAGASLKGDVTILAGEAKTVQFSNEATVTRQGPRRFEYKETLRWSGDKPKDFAMSKPEDMAEIKAALPAPLNTDANAKALMERSASLLIPVMFGPGDPLLSLGLMHPDLAERRATQRIGAVMMKVMEEQFGDKLKPAQRQQVVLKLIETGFSSAKPSQPDPSAGPPSKSSGLVPLMFILKFPGKVVSTNGQIDELTGEVYWALFPEAAVLKEVILTAICEVGGN
ncbi:MAG TPA: hypothetical protein VGP79_17970 [Bryobacteraceae bacterium]|nr:hypothetical protein [Bryobacteraceae bacterium]